MGTSTQDHLALLQRLKTCLGREIVLKALGGLIYREEGEKKGSSRLRAISLPFYFAKCVGKSNVLWVGRKPWGEGGGAKERRNRP